MEQDTQLARWLAGEIEGHELEVLKSSPEYPTLLKIKSTFAAIESPEFESETMLRDIIAAKKFPVRTIPLYKKAWFRYAAIFVVFLSVAAFIALPSRHFAENGETQAFTLPDNSEVILNAGSKAKYLAFYWDDNRKISLTGEAYFKVAKGKNFVVETELGTVKVLGTAFRVKARGDKFEVVCYEGKVGVLHGKQNFELLPGQRIEFGTGPSGIIHKDSAVAPEWLHGEIVANHESLEALTAEIQRQYDVTIHLEAESTQLFSGSLPADNLDAALGILCATFHLKVEKASGEITLVPADALP